MKLAKCLTFRVSGFDKSRTVLSQSCATHPVCGFSKHFWVTNLINLMSGIDTNSLKQQQDPPNFYARRLKTLAFLFGVITIYAQTIAVREILSRLAQTTCSSHRSFSPGFCGVQLDVYGGILT
jgi:hypothetical protein